MTRCHAFETTWGAIRNTGGQTRFRLWAPALDRLAVRTERGEVAMHPQDDGWFQAVVSDLPADSGYAFVLPDGRAVPDPAARAQVGDVHGPSRLVDPCDHRWRVPEWRGRAWQEAVIYELHLGTFTEAGTFDAAAERLAYLASLGVTMVELMPVGQFGGDRGWGYDCVLPYAPHRAYGGPEGLKRFVDAAHAHELMVILDVVYNHFGPDGNYLHLYAPDFFDESRTTPWGAAIAYERAPVRSFFIENALYWLEEYDLDGFRFDAIDQIVDRSEPHILEEIALAVRVRAGNREIHLMTEDSRNITRLHQRDGRNRVRLFTGEWNDDFHNAVHVLATGESEGYYADFAEGPEAKLARALAEGYVFQGEYSVYQKRPRGEPCSSLPPLAFVNFLQNHDQVGNRAMGERLRTLAPRDDLLQALTAIALLNPGVPLLFMGEEWGETNPFLYFTDFHGELADAVREGRRREFAAWAGFSDPAARSRIPDPNAAATMAASRIDWSRAANSDGASWQQFYRSLIALRARRIVPLLAGAVGGKATVRQSADGVVAVSWQLDGAVLHLDANLSTAARTAPASPRGEILFVLPPGSEGDGEASSILPPGSVVFRLDAARDLADRP